MTAREQAAFRAGIRTAIDMARAAALTLEIRDDAGGVRQKAAAAALQGLAEGLKTAFLDTSSRCIPAAFTAVDPSPDVGAHGTPNV